MLFAIVIVVGIVFIIGVRVCFFFFFLPSGWGSGVNMFSAVFPTVCKVERTTGKHLLFLSLAFSLSSLVGHEQTVLSALNWKSNTSQYNTEGGIKEQGKMRLFTTVKTLDLSLAPPPWLYPALRERMQPYWRSWELLPSLLEWMLWYRDHMRKCSECVRAVQIMGAIMACHIADGRESRVC